MEACALRTPHTSSASSGATLLGLLLAATWFFVASQKKANPDRHSGQSVPPPLPALLTPSPQGITPPPLTGRAVPPREEAEAGLTFAGFAVFECPIKAGTPQAVAALRGASHRVLMITGDNELTAWHVAAATGMARGPPAFLRWGDAGAYWVDQNGVACGIWLGISCARRDLASPPPK